MTPTVWAGNVYWYFPISYVLFMTIGMKLHVVQQCSHTYFLGSSETKFLWTLESDPKSTEVNGKLSNDFSELWIKPIGSMLSATAFLGGEAYSRLQWKESAAISFIAPHPSPSHWRWCKSLRMPEKCALHGRLSEALVLGEKGVLCTLLPSPPVKPWKGLLLPGRERTVLSRIYHWFIDPKYPGEFATKPHDVPGSGVRPS